MEGITHGIRPEGDKRVKIKEEPEVKEEEPKGRDHKLRSKYGDVPPVAEKKDPKKKGTCNLRC